MDEKQAQKFHEMTEAPVGRLVCRLAAPCIISMLVTAFYNMADTFFVGMLKNPSATGAVGVVFSLMAIIQAVGFFFGHGSGNFISRELGKQHMEEAENMAATGFFSALAAGILICLLGQLFLTPLATLLGSTPTILPYSREYLRIILFGAPWMTASLVLNNQLRFQGSAAYAMVGITSGAVLNIALDPIMIFWMDLGVAGAAWATIISQFISFCLLLAGSGSSGELLGAYLALVVPGKLSAPWYLLLLRGVLCNFLVCIGVFAGFRLQSETAKALVIALAITTFVLTGLEHSIANMAYFALHALLNGGADWAAMGWNLLWVTLGNLLGGAVLLGLPLWYAAEPEKTQSFS